MLTTVFTTLITGLLIFIFSQVFVVLFLERIRMQARTVEEIAQALVIYGLEYSVIPKDTNPIDQKLVTAQREFRRLAAFLRATVQTLRYYI